MPKAVYGTSPLKRERRSKAEVDSLLATALDILSGDDGRMTIRHLYYLLVSKGAIPKTENGYKNLCQHLSKWRRDGSIEWSAFADNTRWWIKSKRFDSVEEALQNTVDCYRKNLWASQNYYVELWCEKDAIASILADVAAPMGVPVFPLRGYASLSSLYSAAEIFKAQADLGKTPKIFYFGDYDPSGCDIDRSAIATLRDDFDVDVECERVAVTVDQIHEFNLQTRPTKKSDGRSKNFVGESVEVDAIPPAELRELARECITRHIDGGEWKRLQRAEQLEQETLDQVLANFQGRSA